ncbi:MAG: hypothetical protein ACPGVU_21495 [Limisphaerales bacterium]
MRIPIIPKTDRPVEFVRDDDELIEIPLTGKEFQQGNILIPLAKEVVDIARQKQRAGLAGIENAASTFEE